MGRIDPHSHYDDAQPKIRHLELELGIDFDARVLEAVATLELERPAEGVLDLDTRDLALRSVVDDRGETVRFELGSEDPVLGRRLRLFTDRPRVSVEYRTSPAASALQWLEPAQTAGGRQPYVFTQCQAIHARSILPVQDTPAVRFAYDARVKVPEGLTAVFAAAPGGEAGGELRFAMPQPIPSYLFAFAAGDLASRELSPRVCIWGEAPVLELAAHDFGHVEDMIRAAEGLFGPYAWDRFDLLVMPPSFPYGGMENPRLTFLTPTLLTGDRSLANVVAHELAHAWTGNLVTNASIEHFWLNEGFTVYAERRIVEAIEGPERAALQAAIGRRELRADMARLAAIDPQLTALRTRLEGRDPDQVFSSVPYEKGYLFLCALEAAVGRTDFDRFLRSYIETHRFRSLTTETFVEFLGATLPGVDSLVDVTRWLYEPGLPPDAPSSTSAALTDLEWLASEVAKDARPRERLAALDPTEWQVLLSVLPDDVPDAALSWLDAEFGLARASNAEIRVQFLSRAAPRAALGCDEEIREVLGEWGRMKYLRPLYTGLLRRGADGRALAEDAYAEARDRYHPVAQSMVEDLLGAGAA